jgi:glycosyltransferase involved in cell wall biosynthesis
MKVLYIYREKERKAHSIEALFNTISAEVSLRGIEIQEWYKPRSNLKAILSLRKLKSDVYHITGDCYFLALFLPWRKTLMTIHDIGMYKNFPNTLKRRIFALLSFKLPMKVLKVSTAISELTKQDLSQLLYIDANKIKVIPNPLVLPIKYTPKTFNQQKPTILQIGTGKHKNLIGLIEAVKNISCHLDIVGKPDDILINKMDKYAIDYTISSNITTTQVIEKYKQCDILYFASLSEGFGLPILEAQAMGRPLITSNTEPTKWVCGEGGLLVNPLSCEEIKHAILKLIKNQDLRETIIRKGLKNVQRFQLAEITKQYIELYKSMLNK